MQQSIVQIRDRLLAGLDQDYNVSTVHRIGRGRRAPKGVTYAKMGRFPGPEIGRRGRLRDPRPRPRPRARSRGAGGRVAGLPRPPRTPRIPSEKASKFRRFCQSERGRGEKVVMAVKSAEFAELPSSRVPLLDCCRRPRARHATRRDQGAPGRATRRTAPPASLAATTPRAAFPPGPLDSLGEKGSARPSLPLRVPFRPLSRVQKREVWREGVRRSLSATPTKTSATSRGTSSLGECPTKVIRAKREVLVLSPRIKERARECESGRSLAVERECGGAEERKERGRVDPSTHQLLSRSRDYPSRATKASSHSYPPLPAKDPA